MPTKEKLSPEEQQERQELEQKIKSKYSTFTETGTALIKIRESKLYRNTHKTFEEYLQEVWGKTKSTGYQLMWAAESALNIESTTDTQPKNEAQIRHLTRLRESPELQQIAWAEAVELAKQKNKKLTAADVKEIVKSYQSKVLQLYPYLGSKCRLAKTIIQLARQHKFSRIIEPFMGSAAVYFRFNIEGITGDIEYYLNDLDSEVANYVNVLCNQTEELIKAITLTPYSQQEAMIAQSDIDQLSQLERARRFLVHKVQNIAGNKATGFARDENLVRVQKWKKYPDKIPKMASIMNQATFTNIDALDFIQKYTTPETLIYADPPYIEHEEDYRTHFYLHGKLAEILKEIECAGVIVSYYDHEELVPLYPAERWHWSRKTVAKSSGKAKEGEKPQAAELILIRKDKCPQIVRLGGTSATKTESTPSYKEFKNIVQKWNLKKLETAREIINQVLERRSSNQNFL